MSKCSPIKKMHLIVAMDLDGGIGKSGGIPWRLKKDVAFFLKQTTAVENSDKMNAVVMGRKCWDSIPEKFRPLKNRLNVVISRTLPPSRNGNIIISNDLKGIWKELSSGELSDRIETIWNIGGSEIYRLALEQDLVESIVLTKINSRFDADVFLDVNWEEFTEDESKRSETLNDNDIEFSFHVYNKLPKQSS